MRGVCGVRRAVVVVGAALVMLSAGAAAANPGDLDRSLGANVTQPVGRPGFAREAEAMAFEPGGGELLFAGLRRDAITGMTDFALVRLHCRRRDSALGGGGPVTIVLTAGPVSSVAQRSVG